MKGALALLRTPWGRAAAAAVGLGCVAAIFLHLGPGHVAVALRRAASVFPACVLLEGGMLCCTMLGLRTLYGPDRHRLGARALAHAGLVSYVTMLLAPAGRAVAEATRAALLARRSSAVRAAHAAYQMQAACLLGNAFISAFAFAAAFELVGRTGYTWAIGGNFALTLVLGTAMVVAARRGGLGGLLGKVVPQAQDFGTTFDALAREDRAFPLAAACWESAARLLQTVEFTLLVAAVGGALSARSGLVAEGTHLVGAAVGDLIPAQLGAAEANFAVYARALSIDAAGAVAIALLAHLAQLVWVLVGLVTILFAPPTDPVDAAPSPTLEPGSLGRAV